MKNQSSTKRKAHLVFASLLSVLSMTAHAGIEGNWRTIDDETHKPRALINITKQSDGSYIGTYVKPLITPKFTVCQNCPAPYTNQPIQGLKLLTGLKPNPEKLNIFEGGKIIDPASGKIYKAKATLASDDNHLDVRGFIGFSALGRTQTWVRE